MTEETKEQPKGLFDKFMDLYAPLAQQDASLSPQDYAQDFREKQNYVLKQLGLISPTSGVTTPENTRPAEDILLRNGSQDQPTMDAVEQYVNDRVNYNPELGPIPVKDPNDPDEYRRNQMIEMLEINRMFDGLLQADDFALPTINVDQRAAYTSHLLSVVHGDREALAKKLVSKDLKALEGLDDINAFYAGFDKNAVQAESTGSVALNSDFISALRGSESSGRTSAEYKDKKGDRFVGLDQIGSLRLKDFNKATGNNYTQNELKADATKQDEVASWHYNNHAANIKRTGLDRFIGQIDPKSGAEITLSGMLAVAHLGGFGGLQKYLTDQSYTAKDELGTSLSKYMKKFSGLSVEGESSGPGLVSRAGTAIGQALSSPAKAAPLPDSMLPPGFRSTDSQGRPFIRPEVGAEVTQGSMLGGLISSLRSALNLGSDEEAQSAAEKLMQSGIIPRRPVRLPPVRPTEQEMAEANQLTPFESFIEKAKDSTASVVNSMLELGQDIVGTPDALTMLIKDVGYKNTLGIPLNRKTQTKSDLKASTYSALQDLAKIALSKGRMNIEWDDYGVDSNNISIKALIGGGDTKTADDFYPRNKAGFLRLAKTLMVDPKLDAALTIGGASLKKNDKGEIILTDTYDAEKFLKGSASGGIYGFVRNYLGKEGRLSLEKTTDSKIKWEVNLGKLD
jgi:hypothetical protein